MPSYIPSSELVRRIGEGDTFAVSRMISRAEAGANEAREALGRLYRMAGRAHVIGVTGVPGSGKSTLVGRLAEGLRSNHKVAILAIDPTSPYSGGAILGDRVRMCNVMRGGEVYIRSMATRGATGGMARAALDAVDILDVAGFDPIFIETVGVGQDEVEIASAAHTTVVVSPPGLGDEIQAMKAGLLEIADLHVVSKCDRSDSNRTIADLQRVLGMSARRDGWIPPIIGASSVSGQGLEALTEALDLHRVHVQGDEGRSHRRRAAQFRLSKITESLLLERFNAITFRRSQELTEDLLMRRNDPYSAASQLCLDFVGEAIDA